MDQDFPVSMCSSVCFTPIYYCANFEGYASSTGNLICAYGVSLAPKIIRVIIISIISLLYGACYTLVKTFAAFF